MMALLGWIVLTFVGTAMVACGVGALAVGSGLRGKFDWEGIPFLALGGWLLYLSYTNCPFTFSMVS